VTVGAVTTDSAIVAAAVATALNRGIFNSCLLAVLVRSSWV
jgi:hypothetical protein